MSERIVITVPGCPDRRLAPNRQKHGREKAGPISLHRADAKYAVLGAFGVDHGIRFTGPVSVAVLVRWGRGERVHDLDTVAIMSKPFLDGLTDAGIWTDDAQMQRLTVEQEPYRLSKVAGGEVVITIEGILT